MEYIADLHTFIVDNFLFGENGQLENDTSFLQSGIIDSTGILELVTHLEDTYSISIEDNELVPENLDSLTNVSKFLKKKVTCAG